LASGICCNYSFDTVESTWENIRNFAGGTALFTHPDTPVKCGGAPQKICYLAEDHFRKQGIRDKCNVVFALAKPRIFAVDPYASTLEKMIERLKKPSLTDWILVKKSPSSTTCYT